MNKEEIEKIPKIEKNLLDKIEHILGSELNCDEYDIFYNYFNEIKKPNILVEIKDCEEIINCMEKLQQENKQLKDKLEEKTYLYNKLSTESKYVIKDLQERIDKAIEYINHA